MFPVAEVTLIDLFFEILIKNCYIIPHQYYVLDDAVGMLLYCII